MRNSRVTSIIQAGRRSVASWKALLALVAGVLLLPTEAQAWWNQDWAFRKQITVDAAQAVPAATELQDQLVLIRLHEGILTFSDVKPDGSDLRFIAGDDQTPLAFHLERYDEVFNLAFAWVRVPRLKAGEPFNIWLYYGNPKATSEGSSRSSYDAHQLLVWHLSERGAPAADATGNSAATATSFASVDGSLIGGGARFDGSAGLSLPESAPLGLSSTAPRSWSLWVKPAQDTQTSVLFEQMQDGVGLRLGLEAGVPYAEVVGSDGAPLRLTAGSAAGSSSWHHLAVSAGSTLSLYVDGAVQGTPISIALPAVTSPGVLAPVFVGELDEFEVASGERSAGATAYAAANQGTSDISVRFGADEAQSSWSTGYVGVILGSVTLDGWVIIAVLGVMMLISWVVMARKGGQISRVGKANLSFLELFRSIGGDFSSLHQALSGRAAAVDVDLSEGRRQLLMQSPLAHMFSAGVDELRQRLKGEARHGELPAGSLSAQSIEAIRATIDASLVREVQSLNSQLVLLTIAISGGPFIGLLGTVVGVMITFAAVAASGDVNINAIAPGIAAALAATVAGLFVAIPSLFGYNYLITRIKDISAEMQVFVDAFIARMAENYHSPDALHRMSDH